MPVLIGAVVLGLAVSDLSHAQRGRRSGPPPARAHQVRQSDGQLQLVRANVPPPADNDVSITVQGSTRQIRSNGIPDHDTGRFPNRGNPHRIEEQTYTYRIPARPTVADRILPLKFQSFGIAVNGVPFDPGAAEWFRGDRRGKWQYEALSGAVPLGLDANHAHVQPNGAYHYHGLPATLLADLGSNASTHSPQVGWAADGFPMYALYGYEDGRDPASRIKKLTSSYRVRSGNRSDGSGDPGGTYDGTFISDYEYIEGLGDLDECNGRMSITPDFPKGTYAYFLTESWPVIPRWFKGTSSRDFLRRGPPRGASRGGHTPPR